MAKNLPPVRPPSPGRANPPKPPTTPRNPASVSPEFNPTNPRNVNPGNPAQPVGPEKVPAGFEVHRPDTSTVVVKPIAPDFPNDFPDHPKVQGELNQDYLTRDQFGNDVVVPRAPVRDAARGYIENPQTEADREYNRTHYPGGRSTRSK